MIYVVNKKNHEATARDVVVGRGTPLGNPYDWRGSPLAKFKCCCRDAAIARYKEWFTEQVKAENPEVLDELRRIYKMAKEGDVYLVCFCVPLNCHAFIIKKFIEQYLK